MKPSWSRLPSIVLLLTALAPVIAAHKCLTFVEAHSNPLFPALHRSCSSNVTEARNLLNARLDIACRSPMLSVNQPIAAGVAAEAFTAFTLLALPLAISAAEWSRSTSSYASRSPAPPYTAFVLLACALHLVVITALYATDGSTSVLPSTPLDALYEARCCQHHSRLLLMEPLCAGGSLVARVTPRSYVLRTSAAKMGAAFVAAVWALCGLSVVRATRRAGRFEAEPLLGPKGVAR